VADRWGRKWPVVLSTLVFATFAIFTARATSFDQLLTFRFLTGLGLGGAIPNAIALTSEYVPKRLLSVSVAMLTCGMPLGALVGGLVSSVMIPTWGWRSVFYLGGILPLAVSLVLIKVLPESVQFLTIRGAEPQRISRIMARISPELGDVPVSSLISREHRREGVPVMHLFTEGRAIGTILLWVTFMLSLLILYFIVNWLPALLRQVAMPISAGVTAVSLFSLGGVLGTLVQGRLMNGFGPYVVMLAEFGLCTLFVGSLGFITASFFLMMTVTVILGCCVQGAQAGLNALAASFYPTSMRSTGVGWALGVGRIGSIVGPVLGGMLLSLEWSPQQIFLAAAVPALCSALAITLGNGLRGNAAVFRPEPDPGRV
jgi:MFS transporter, AAHS family, 4-hydroxybenzoate transporter